MERKYILGISRFKRDDDKHMSAVLPWCEYRVEVQVQDVANKQGFIPAANTNGCHLFQNSGGRRVDQKTLFVTLNHGKKSYRVPGCEDCDFNKWRKKPNNR